jgi:hypothetical protein
VVQARRRLIGVPVDDTSGRWSGHRRAGDPQGEKCKVKAAAKNTLEAVAEDCLTRRSQATDVPESEE